MLGGALGGMLGGMLRGARSVLFVHAHPDDETIGTGALMSELAARGVRVCLLTATRGERGEVVPGALSDLEGTSALADQRERELRGATTALGVTERFWLGDRLARAADREPRRYRDSGMVWVQAGLAGPAPDAAADALAVASLTEVARDVAALIAQLQPELVVSYDHGGGYGHPDHVRTREAALAASRDSGTPFAEIVDGPGPGTDWYDFPGRLATVTAALRCHATQLSVHGEFIVHSGGQRERIRTAVGLRRV